MLHALRYPRDLYVLAIRQQLRKPPVGTSAPAERTGIGKPRWDQIAPYQSNPKCAREKVQQLSHTASGSV